MTWLKRTAESNATRELMKVKREPKPRRLCIFDKKTPISGEHLFSEWISAIVPRTSDRHTQALTPSKSNGTSLSLGETTFVRREGDISSKRLHVVCRGCNSGWMSNLIEKPTIPILSPLIRGEASVITPASQMTIATWATLKSIIYEQDDKQSAAIPPAQIARFFETKSALPGFKIWIGYYDGTQWSTGTKCTHVGDRVLLSTPTPFGLHHQVLSRQTSTFVIGKLYIHVFSSTIENVFYGFQGRLGSVLHAVQPVADSDITWPPPIFLTDEDAGQIALALAAGARKQEKLGVKS